MNNIEKVKYVDEPKEKKQLREEKERLSATRSFQALWKDYMDGHTKGWNMDSYEADKFLFARFKRFKSSGKFEKLPKPLQHTFSVGYSLWLVLGRTIELRLLLRHLRQSLGV